MLGEWGGVGGWRLKGLDEAEEVDKPELIDYFRRGVCGVGFSGWKK